MIILGRTTLAHIKRRFMNPRQEVVHITSPNRFAGSSLPLVTSRLIEIKGIVSAVPVVLGVVFYWRL